MIESSSKQPTPGDAEQPWWQSEYLHTSTPQRDYATAPLVEPEPGVSTAEAENTRQLSSNSVPTLSALRSRRELAAAAQRDVGRVRSSNQDSVYAMIASLPRESRNVQMGLFVVADGMGGHDGGEIASRRAVYCVAHHMLEHLLLPALDDAFAEALQPLMIAAVQDANRVIFEHARSIGSDMGTTCSAALLLGNAIYVAHVGDSRVYVRTPGGLQQITDDHSAVGRLLQLGQITPEQAREHPQRSQLYRTVGQQAEVPIDFVYQSISGSTHLLLCSDGLWSMLDNAEIDEVLEQSFWPQDACKELIARANLAGGEDNISVVVVTLPASGGSG